MEQWDVSVCLEQGLQDGLSRSLCAPWLVSAACGQSLEGK